MLGQNVFDIIPLLHRRCREVDDEQIDGVEISFLELLSAAQMHVKHAPFHPYWHKKWCTLADVAEEIKMFQPNMADKVNSESLKMVRTREEAQAIQTLRMTHACVLSRTPGSICGTPDASMATRVRCAQVYTMHEDNGGLLYEAKDDEEEGTTGENEHGNAERAHMLERYLHDILQENAKISKELREAGIEPH